MKEYNDIELANKIRSFLTRKASGEFRMSKNYKIASMIPKGTFGPAKALRTRKMMDIYLDRDRSEHSFRVASPRFNANLHI